MILETEVLRVLSQVHDPDLKRDIVGLGFVKRLKVKRKRVSFDLELAIPIFPEEDELRQTCIAKLKELGANEVRINMSAKIRSAPVTGKAQLPGISNLVAVASGKGGVGKSTVSINLALALVQAGVRVGLMDCDFYGPSLPFLVNQHARVGVDHRQKIQPHDYKGLKLMSMGFFVERAQAVAWRGPMLHKMMGQFLNQVDWGDLDYLILDLPPGTGDVQLTLTQSFPLSGALLVTTPQLVALRDVEKGLHMFRKVNIPILGVVENMSYYLCGSCQKRHAIFKSGGAQRLAQTYKLPLLGEIPLEPTIPSELGRGEPMMVRQAAGPSAQIFRRVASNTMRELSKISQSWAVSGPDAMEV